MNTIFNALDKFDDQEIIQEHFQFHIQKMNANWAKNYALRTPFPACLI